MVAIGFGPKSIREENFEAKDKRSALANIRGQQAGWTSAPEEAGGKEARPDNDRATCRPRLSSSDGTFLPVHTQEVNHQRL